MEEKPGRGPSPWLGPILTCIAILVAIIWAYLQMRHWREPEADYVAIATNILVTLILWVLLIIATVVTYRRRNDPVRLSIKRNWVIAAVIIFALGLGVDYYASGRGLRVPPIPGAPTANNAPTKKDSNPGTVPEAPKDTPARQQVRLPQKAKQRTNLAKQKSEDKAGPIAEAPPPSSQPPTVTNNCPNGICISGGKVDRPTVNNFPVTQPPPPKITWTSKERVEPINILGGAGPNPLLKHPGTRIVIIAQGRFQFPMFSIRCDRPCNATDISVDGASIPITYTTNVPTIAVAGFRGVPAQIEAGTEVTITAHSLDDSDIKVQEAAPYVQ